MDEIEKRFEEITSHPDTVHPDAIMLGNPSFLISDKPLQSRYYADCNAVVILSPDLVGLSHYNLKNSPPEEYLPRLIAEMLAATNNGSLSAVPVGGDREHFERNKRILGDHKIPIVGEYCDGWEEGETLPLDFSGRKSEKADKHLVVVPSTQEVLMFSNPVGYKRLTQ